MNKLIYILVLGFLPLAFSCCGAAKDKREKGFQKPPFKIIEGTFHTWVGGQPGVRGLRIEIAIDNSKIKLDTVYFRNMKTKLKKNNNSTKELYIGTFVIPQKKNLRLDIDSKKEFGNEAPDVSKKIPFQLKSDEAVVSYFYKNNLEFFKVENLIEIKPEFN